MQFIISITNFFIKSVFSTNHKDIGTFRVLLSAGFLGLMLSIIMRITLATPKNGIFEGNFQIYNSIVTAYCFGVIKKNDAYWFY